MDDQSSTVVSSTPRPSAIPRLSSRLPLPRPSSSLANHAASSTRSPLPLAPLNEKRVTQSIGRQSLLGTVRARPSLLPPPTPSAINATRRPPPNSHTLKRQPLGPPLRPSSKQGPLPKSQPDQIEVDGVLYVKAQRRQSEQENDSQEQQSGDETLVTPDESTMEVESPTPSLSDRTIESLANIPTAPGSVRRRSSFFNPYSPMTPSRPPSTMDNYSVSKLNYGSVRRTAPPRQSTSYNTKTTVSQVATPARPATSRRSISSALHQSSVSSARPILPSRTDAAAAKSIARPASVAVPSRNPPTTQHNGRMSAARLTRPSSSLSDSNKIAISSRPVSRLKTELRPLGPSTRQPVPRGIEKTTFKKPAPTSAALRMQIAQARSLQRGATINAAGSRSGLSSDSPSLKECADPFNQNTINEAAPLQRRIDAARRDGRLNISSLNLTTIPDQVLHMYDAEAMESSSITWSETVDISRVIAADNELESIPDAIFPDPSTEGATQGEEITSNLFGGVELLDLHGNMLQSLPLGLRRLELLTTLNLSRNKFENSVFDILTQMPALRDLSLACNELSRDLPESVSTLTNLETLDLHNNKLVLLPASIRSLVHLRVLNLSDNRFSDLAMDSLVQLPSLLEIHASKNALTGSLFPSTVQEIPNLRILDVSNNSIASLSFSATLTLPSLTHLDVSRNRLFALPEISGWTSLLNLLAEDNGLTELPPGFTKLDGVKSAVFKGNGFRTVDVEVGRMKGLERLGLEGNPLRERRWASASWEVVKREMLRRLDDTEALNTVQGVGLGIVDGVADYPGAEGGVEEEEVAGEDEMF